MPNAKAQRSICFAAQMSEGSKNIMRNNKKVITDKFMVTYLDVPSSIHLIFSPDYICEN